MTEIWKPVKGFENYYKISNTGKIFSIKKGRLKATSYNQDGYERTSLFVHTKKTKHASIHRLVAEAFIPNPNNYTDVNHIDGNKKNNRISNLEWCTRSYNRYHAFKLGLASNAGERNPAAKLTVQDVIYIRKYYKSSNVRELSKMFNINRTRIWAIATGKSWRSV